MSSPEIAYWECCEQEELAHTEIDEAVEQWLDDAWEERFRTMTGAERLAALPTTIEAVGFTRRIPAVSRYDRRVLNTLHARIDEDNGNPAEYTAPTKEMRDLTTQYVADILRLYTPWAFKEVETVTVVVADWIRAHDPKWLEPDEGSTT